MAIEPTRAPTTTRNGIELLPDDERRTVLLFLSSIANANTREAYARDIRAYVRWLAELAGHRDWSLLDATAEAAAAWTRWMLDPDGEALATATAARRQSAMSKFYRWGSRPGRFHAGRPNPFDPDMIDRVRPSSRHAQAITSRQVAALMKATAAGPHPARDWALITLMATTGLRVSELCAANRSDVEASPAGAELVIVGKGSKVRRVAVIPQLAQALGIGDGSEDGPLLTANDGGRLDRHRVTRILRRLARAASIEKLTPHMLRATQITEALMAGQPLWAVQDNAGHSDPRTTRGYQRRAQSSEALQAMGTALWARFADAAV